MLCLAGYAHKLDMKLQKLCGNGFSLFTVCMLIKCHHLDGVNWPTTLWKQRCRVLFLNKGHLGNDLKSGCLYHQWRGRDKKWLFVSQA